MRILLINNFHYLRGGDCRYTFGLSDLLERHGHDVARFSMHHPANEAYKYDRYFVSHIDYEQIRQNPSFKSIRRTLATSFWNVEAQQRLRGLLDEFKPDIAHLQNILHHITPSIVPVLKERGIPMVQHLHDYNLICPDIYLLRNGKICEECFGRRYYRGALHRCKKNSVAASTLAVAQRYLHDGLKVFGGISRYVAPSIFARQKFKAAGFPYTDRIEVVPYFVDPERIRGDSGFDAANGVVFAGRLIKEKGLWTLLKAAAINPDIPIQICGDGVLKADLQKYIADERLANVQLLGWRSLSDILDLLRGACALVMPSEWYETMGISILEAAAVGRAAIVSSNTAMSEIVQHEQTGLVFTMGNSDELAHCIGSICRNRQLARQLGMAAHRRVESLYSAEVHYQAITGLYGRVLGERP